MRHSKRVRLGFVEGHAKRHKWRRVALVGLTDMALARQFLVNFPACSVLVVPVWKDEAELRPGERAWQRNQQRNLRVWSRAYAKRFEFDDGPAVKVASRVGEFDGVVLWDGLGEGDLAAVGGAWVACVKDGGWMLGLDYRSGVTRAILDQVAPRQWSHFREGIWGVRVRRAGDGSPAGGAAVEADVDTALPAEVGTGRPVHVDLTVDEKSRAEPRDVAKPDARPDMSPADVDEPVAALAIGGGETHTDSSAAEPIVAPKRRGGRPKGSRNKPKAVAPE